MEHNYESNIKCPYCDWEDEDSWEFGEDEGTVTCGRCDEEFNVVREIEVTYSSSKIDCSDREPEIEHKYDILSNYFRRDKEYTNGTWIPLEISQYQYFKIFKCSICDDSKYQLITKEEYESWLDNGR